MADPKARAAAIEAAKRASERASGEVEAGGPSAQAAIAAADEARARAVAAPAVQGAQRARPEHSPKHKAERGVPEGHVTSWVPCDMPAEDNEVLQAAAKVRRVKLPAMLAGLLSEALRAEWGALRADAARFVPAQKAEEKRLAKLESMSVEQLEAEIERQRAAIEQLQRLTAARAGGKAGA